MTIRFRIFARVLFVACAAALAVQTGCDGGAGASALFNPAFINSRSGGVVPVTPGPGADFVFVRVINATNQTLEFIVTIERDVLVLDDDGNPQRDEDDQLITSSVRETVRLITGATGDSTELGVLFPCNVSRVTRVGLGENLLPTDAAVFVGGAGAGGGLGFGVPADDLNPLDLFAGNFNCGDTIIFRAFVQAGTAGGTALQSFLLPGFEQPSQFSGPNTFVIFQQFLESQVAEQP